MLEKKVIVEARINSSFQEISDYFGYDVTEWTDEIAELLQLWQEQGYIEIYQTLMDRKFGLVKDSSVNAKGSITPFYIGLFHARLINGENDPLIVVKFHATDNGDIADMRFMIDHNCLFGSRAIKQDFARLRALWLEIDGKIKTGDIDYN